MVKRYLVTGGAGFIGSHLVDALLARGDQVIVLDDLSSGNTDNLVNLSTKDAVINLYMASVTESDEIRRVVQHCDGIFHLAAKPFVAQSVEEPVETHLANTFGTVVVLNEARQKNVPVVFVSSSSVYGNQSRELGENSITRPTSPYAATKLAGEAYCKAFASTYKLPITIVRPFNVYGPRQNPDSDYAGVIARFCQAVVRNEQPIIYGTGSQCRDFIYAGDVARGLLLAMDAASASCPVFNLGTGHRHSVKEVLRCLTDQEPEFRDARPGDVQSTRAAITHAWHNLGFTADTLLVEGLKTTLEWYRENNND